MPRGRPKSLSPSIDTHLFLPEEIYARISLALWSDAEGRIPHGQMSKFFVARANEFFARKPLDLGPYLGQPTGTFMVWAEPGVLEALERRLAGPVGGQQANLKGTES